MSRFPWVAPRGRVLSWRSAVAAGALVVTGVLIAVQTGGIGPAGTDAGSARMLRAGAVSGLGAGSPGGMMGSYAIDAATAADAQVASVLGISDDAAWSRIAVTPMIGVNDVTDEVFTLANARQLVAFAASKHLAWLSMWSAARDTGCSGGAQMAAQPMCSSIAQSPGAFATALGAYGPAGSGRGLRR